MGPSYNGSSWSFHWLYLLGMNNCYLVFCYLMLLFVSYFWLIINTHNLPSCECSWLFSNLIFCKETLIYYRLILNYYREFALQEVLPCWNLLSSHFRRRTSRHLDAVETSQTIPKSLLFRFLIRLKFFIFLILRCLLS